MALYLHGEGDERSLCGPSQQVVIPDDGVVAHTADLSAHTRSVNPGSEFSVPGRSEPRHKRPHLHDFADGLTREAVDHLSVQQNFPLPVIADAGDLQDNTEGKITKSCDLETLEAGPEGQRALSWTVL